MGIGMAAGREFLESDAAGSAPVAMISETVARRYWPHANPLGNQLTILVHVYSGQSAGTTQSLRIGGVVKDRRGSDLWERDLTFTCPSSSTHLMGHSQRSNRRSAHDSRAVDS